jgi:isopenicillin N synthase-like dioxygenase
MEIPIVDFDGFLNGKNRQAISKEVINVVKNHGFVYLRNYGIPKDSVYKLFDLNKKFFDKPLDYKNSVKRSFKTLCGYDAMLEEKANRNGPGDLKEAFMIKNCGTPWPNDWNDFKEFMELFQRKCYLLALEILRSFAIGLDFDENFFDEKFKKGECALLRLIHYPPLPDVIEENQIRAGEHTDFGALTILFQDPTGGLEVKTLDNKWIPAPYHENTVLINVGDVMDIWTNGLLRSTPHRVINPLDDRMLKSRYSTAFFFEPDLDVELKCIEQFVSVQNPAKFKPRPYKEFLFGNLKASYNKFDNIS